jgi:hypothetical protein
MRIGRAENHKPLSPVRPWGRARHNMISYARRRYPGISAGLTIPIAERVTQFRSIILFSDMYRRRRFQFELMVMLNDP